MQITLRGKILAFLLAVPMFATAQTYTVLHNFSGPEGSQPTSALAVDAEGNLYGTTFAGGANGLGTVFKITPTGMYTLLHSFSGADGAHPYAGLTFVGNGYFFGTTNSGGTANLGTIFVIDSAGTFGVAHNFSGFDGNNPYGGVAEATDFDGVLAVYGFTSGGGQSGYGTAYRLDANGVYTVLHNFMDSTDGAYLYSTPLVVDGLLLGVTRRGGSANDGTAFVVNDAGAFEALDYYGPFAQSYSGFVAAQDGTYYATTSAGGIGYGSVMSLDPDLTLTNVASFNGGGFPFSGVIVAQDGNLYGAATGGNGIYEVTPAGAYSAVHAFTGTDGDYPIGAPMQASWGTLYGTTYAGGTHGLGVVYSLSLTTKTFKHCTKDCRP